MDFLPSLTHLAGGEVPQDRIIDGRDVRDLMLAKPGARSPHEFFAYYFMDNLEAIRSGPWKYHFWKQGRAVQELYNLAEDIGESKNVIADHPDVVKRLAAYADRMREDLGDALTKAPGKNCRPSGRVANPKPLTQYNPDHPYIMAMYDLPDCG